MKITPNFLSFRISAKGMSIQKKKMELVTENIANMSTTKTADGKPYKRKYLVVKQIEGNKKTIPLRKSLTGDVFNELMPVRRNSLEDAEKNIITEVKEDGKDGELVYMPDHPDANEDGYVQMPNVNVVTEMVDMIAASRSFEANVAAFQASKQIAKNSLEI